MTGITYSRGSASSPVTGKDVNMLSGGSGGGGVGSDGNGGSVNQPPPPLLPPATSSTTRNVPLVDVRLQDARAVFLRGEAGGAVSETGLRRMGFEVSEWLRDIEGRERDRAKRERTRS